MVSILLKREAARPTGAGADSPVHSLTWQGEKEGRTPAARTADAIMELNFAIVKEGVWRDQAVRGGRRVGGGMPT